jgi:site-specific DNA-methyltransferase (adenine-specific)/modification methylase
MAEKVVIGNAELWHGDCREVLPLLPQHDLLLTDPPYGLSYVPSQPGATHRTEMRGDDGSIDLSFLPYLSTNVITWGANCYPQVLPYGGRWLCWDKRGGIESADRMLGSPFELAWTNRTTGYDKIIRLLHGGVVNCDKANAKRDHPTQKPVRLMEWCLALYPKALTVIDPFMGSGTTGVACAKLGKAFTGIDIERRYFDIACERIENAQRQGVLLPSNSETAPKQHGFCLEI